MFCRVSPIKYVPFWQDLKAYKQVLEKWHASNYAIGLLLNLKKEEEKEDGVSSYVLICPHSVSFNFLILF